MPFQAISRRQSTYNKLIIMTLSIPNFHVQCGSVGYICYQEVHTYDTISTCGANGCTCTVCLLPPWRAGFTVCGRDILSKCNTGGIFPKCFLTSTLTQGSVDTLEKLFSCALVMCKPGQQPKASHSQDLNSSLSLQAASPCSKHLGQALPDFSDSGQKFKYYFKWIKKLRTKNIIPIKKNVVPCFTLETETTTVLKFL